MDKSKNTLEHGEMQSFIPSVVFRYWPRPVHAKRSNTTFQTFLLSKKETLCCSVILFWGEWRSPHHVFSLVPNCGDFFAFPVQVDLCVSTILCVLNLHVFWHISVNVWHQLTSVNLDISWPFSWHVTPPRTKLIPSTAAGVSVDRTAANSQVFMKPGA